MQWRGNFKLLWMCWFALWPVVFFYHSPVNGTLVRQPPLSKSLILVAILCSLCPSTCTEQGQTCWVSSFTASMQILLTSQGALQRPSRLVFTDVANAINAWTVPAPALGSCWDWAGWSQQTSDFLQARPVHWAQLVTLLVCVTNGHKHWELLSLWEANPLWWQ